MGATTTERRGRWIAAILAILAILPAPAPGTRRRLARYGGLFALCLAYMLATNLRVARYNGTTGDEPWYLLASYALIHQHTVNLAAVLRDPAVYAAVVGADVPVTHIEDYRHNGERIEPYLPGYAALIAPFYALGGRTLVIVFQCILAALIAVLLFAEAARLFASRAVGFFALLAYTLSLPSLLYAGQVFTSTVAAFLCFAGFLLVGRVLPVARGRRLVLVGALLGLGIFALPWVHVKYTWAALALVGLALWALWPRLRGEEARAARLAAALIAGLLTLSFVGIILYSRRYFGTWLPQYGGAVDLAHPNLGRAGDLYLDVFLSPQRGLFPWVPLDLLVAPGLVLLWRRDARTGARALVLLGALLASFLSVIVAVSVGQAYALPARFTVECAPFFALALAAVFAQGLPALRAAASTLRERKFVQRPENSWRSVAPRLALGLGCLALLAAGGWFAQVGASDPGLLYPTVAGPRLAEHYPDLVPAWWFAAFPESPDLHPRYPVVVALAPPTRAADLVSAGGLAPLALSDWVEAPPGRFAATATFACIAEPIAAATTPASTSEVWLLVERGYGSHPLVIARQSLAAAACAGPGRPLALRVAFGSVGYKQIRFVLAAGPGVAVSRAQVAYTPGA